MYGFCAFSLWLNTDPVVQKPYIGHTRFYLHFSCSLWTKMLCGRTVYFTLYGFCVFSLWLNADPACSAKTGYRT